MQTRGCNRLVIEQNDDEDVRPYIEQLMDGQNYYRAQPYIEQLMDDQNFSEAQAHDDQSKKKEPNSSAGGTEIQHNDDQGQANKTSHRMIQSIATLMNEQVVDGKEPTRAETFILTHKKCNDGGPMDDDGEMNLMKENQEKI